MLSANSDSVFEVCFLGMVQDVNLGMHMSQKTDVLLIDKVEEAQVGYQTAFQRKIYHVYETVYTVFIIIIVYCAS